MATKLVIVESPAKAKTIKSYLGPDYEVLASIGHIRDLPLNGKSLPEELKKKWWADYAVDVDNNFEPIYEVSEGKSAQVSKIRQAMKGKDTIVLATDEDREGESISWHLLEILKPAKSVKVQRIAFHEITKEAIQAALAKPRQIDYKLVEAQEARRILDRLYGYTLSPILWTRVTKNLSAGRVQSPAVKLVVDREEERRRFVPATYWDLTATLKTDKNESFQAILRTVNETRIATGKDFDDETGQLSAKSKAILLAGERAAELGKACETARPWVITNIEEKEVTERPAPPFMTTTLQQEANRKFNFPADITMRIAQTLYEGVEIGGQITGLISYMRTDSLSLSSEALGKVRNLIEKEYPDCLPAKPNAYTSKVRNAQEAHEAIRPTEPSRRPQDVAKYLSKDQARIYELIWQRTIACQMKPALALRTEVEIEVEANKEKLGFAASGKRYTFLGFRKLYQESHDDDDAQGDKILPPLKLKQQVEPDKITTDSHTTKAPSRFTDAALIKALEERGIGRPSTYASILSTIADRGYVRKQGKTIIPTWRAFLSMRVLEDNFHEFMELDFTAQMDEELDKIADGAKDSRDYLSEFFLGKGEKIGLKQAVTDRKAAIEYPNYVIGEHPELKVPIVLRNGKDGNAFLQVEVGSERKYANIPDDLAPADLSLAKALELFDQKTAPSEAIGIDPVTGRTLLVKFRQGYYLETERSEEEIKAKEKPRWISVPPGIDPRNLSQEDISFLCQLPRTIGKHPESNKEITYKIGRFGPYVECAGESRTVENWEDGKTMTVDQAVELLAAPKFAGRAQRATKGAIAEFGELEGAEGPVKVLAGRFGPYVTDGTTNATLPRGVDPASLTPERAMELIIAKREAGPSAKPKKFKRTVKSSTSKAKAKTPKKSAKKKK